MGNPVSTIVTPGTPGTPDDFIVESRPPAVGFLTRAVQPPSNVYIEINDILIVAAASSATNEVVTFSYRFLRSDGALINGQFTLAVPTLRVIATRIEPLAEGFLLSASCKAAIATTRGVTFVRAFLSNPALGAGQPSNMLMSDYITTAMAPAHPNGRVLSPVEGPGNPYMVQIANPGLGAEWATQVPINARWKLTHGYAQFTTGAPAGNRTPGIIIFNGGFANFIGFGENNIGPGTVANVGYSSVRNAPAGLTSSAWAPMPIDTVTLGFNVIQSRTLGLNAADSYAGVQIGVEEWLDNV
jgi:hypothetical protein